MFRECLAGRPYPQVTHKTQLSPSVLTLRIPIMCRAHASFAGCLVASYRRKLFYLQLLESSHSFSIIQPLQLNPTINTGYKRLSKITIKFGMELKPTKHIVVNYNFTQLIKIILDSVNAICTCNNALFFFFFFFGIFGLVL